MSKLKYDTVIFDLDGTLLDTLEDLAAADNYALEKAGLPAVPVSTVKMYVGNGVRNLMLRSVYGPEFTRRFVDVARLREDQIHYSRNGTGYVESFDGMRFILPVSGEEFEMILNEFRAYYSTHSAVRTRPYTGIREMIRELGSRGCSMAVVSNKFDEAVKNLCRQFFPEIGIAIGTQDGLNKKPSPDMVLKACALLGSRCNTPVYAGDSEVDIATAFNSGMECITCLWGFRDRAFLEKNGAEYFAYTPYDIIDIVEKGMEGHAK